jgi:alkylation response protein AidB-like acyl-CoA dehydrogenase
MPEVSRLPLKFRQMAADFQLTRRIYEGATEVQKLIIGRDLLKPRN